MKLHRRVESQKERLGHPRKMRSIRKGDNEINSALAAFGSEVNGFGLQLAENGVNGFAELALFNERVAAFGGHGSFDEKTHSYLHSLSVGLMIDSENFQFWLHASGSGTPPEMWA